MEEAAISAAYRSPTMSTIERAVPGFLPSTAGFHFANRWPSAPALRCGARLPGPVPVGVELRIGDVANGLCGGMALAAIDRWERGLAPPPDREPPAEGSPLFREIVRRQIDSLELGRAVARFFLAGARSPWGRARSAVRDVWPAVRRAIDEGRPASLGLVHVASRDPRTLVGDHQVVVYGYELDASAGAVSLRIYDPNHPDDDAVRLRLTLGGGGGPRPGPAGDRGPLDYRYIEGETPVLGLVRMSGRPA
jgi:hypothetical protein